MLTLKVIPGESVYLFVGGEEIRVMNLAGERLGFEASSNVVIIREKLLSIYRSGNWKSQRGVVDEGSD